MSIKQLLTPNTYDLYELAVANDVAVGGDLDVIGDTDITGDLFVGGTITGGGLSATGNIDATGAVGDGLTNDSVKINTITDRELQGSVDKIYYAPTINQVYAEVRDDTLITGTGDVLFSTQGRKNFVFGQEFLGQFQRRLRVGVASKILLGGDSTTYGFENTYPSNRLLVDDRIDGIIYNYLCKIGITNVSVVNSGVNSMTMQQWNTDTAPEAQGNITAQIAETANLYVYRWGINELNFGATLKQTIDRLRTGLGILRTAYPAGSGVGIIICSPNANFPDGGTNQRTPLNYSLLVAGMKRAAIDFNCCFIDIWNEFNFHEEAVNYNYLDSVSLHPEPSLNHLIGSRILDVILPKDLETNGLMTYKNTLRKMEGTTKNYGNTGLVVSGRNLCPDLQAYGNASYTTNGTVSCNGEFITIGNNSDIGYSTGRNIYDIASTGSYIDGLQTGSIKMTVKTGYSGTPTGLVFFFVINGSGLNNFMGLYHNSTGGTLEISASSSTGVSKSKTFGVFNPVAGTSYNLEFSWDFTNGTSYLFIDGVISGTVWTDTFTRTATAITDVNNHKLRLGEATSGAVGFAFKDLNMKPTKSENTATNYSKPYTLINDGTIALSSTLRLDPIKSVETMAISGIEVAPTNGSFTLSRMGTMGYIEYTSAQSFTSVGAGTDITITGLSANFRPAVNRLEIPVFVYIAGVITLAHLQIYTTGVVKIFTSWTNPQTVQLGKLSVFYLLQ